MHTEKFYGGVGDWYFTNTFFTAFALGTCQAIQKDTPSKLTPTHYQSCKH